MVINSTGTPKESGSGMGSYALSGKVMLCSVIILFLVILLVITFHLYTRWLVRNARRRHRRHRLPLGSMNTNNHNYHPILPQGLDPLMLKCLPTFVYSSEAHPGTEGIDCAVCLSQFEENEMGRILPKCGHSFHLDCIAMWFQSHSNCPLCRAQVSADEASQPLPHNPNEIDVIISESGSHPESNLECNQNGESVSSASAGFVLEECQRKSLDLVGIVLDLNSKEDSGRTLEETSGGSDSLVDSDNPVESYNG